MKRQSYILSLIWIALFISCKHPAESNSSDRTNLQVLNEQILQDPNKASLYFDRGSYFFQQESYKNAVSDLIKAIQLDSMNGAYYFLLSDAYLYDYRSKDAVEILEKYIGFKPGNTEALLKLTRLQYTLRQYDIAILTVNEVFKNDLQNAEALFLLGAILQAKGNDDAAINALRSAVETDPEIIDAWVMLGDLLAKKGDPDAYIYYDNALAVDGENITALHSKAFYLQNHSQIPDALSLYEKIHIIDSTYADAYLNAGILQLEMKQNEKGYLEFDRLAKLYPELGPAYYYRAISLELLNRKEEALSDYKTSLKLAPDFQKAKDAIDALESEKE